MWKQCEREPTRVAPGEESRHGQRRMPRVRAGVRIWAAKNSTVRSAACGLTRVENPAVSSIRYGAHRC